MASYTQILFFSLAMRYQALDVYLTIEHQIRSTFLIIWNPCYSTAKIQNPVKKAAAIKRPDGCKSISIKISSFDWLENCLRLYNYLSSLIETILAKPLLSPTKIDLLLAIEILSTYC